jgi:hypothetical protein
MERRWHHFHSLDDRPTRFVLIDEECIVPILVWGTKKSVFRQR